MKVHNTSLATVSTIEPFVIKDIRGEFSRIFCQEELKDLLQGKNIQQINISKTLKRGSIRGLHYQKEPFSEIKIIRCLKGRVFDVAVDIRPDSSTFLSWTAVELSSEDGNLIVIPQGFAHGFQSLENNSELLYLHTASYAPASEGGLRFNDPKIQIEWPLSPMEISERDKLHPLIDNNFTGINP